MEKTTGVNNQKYTKRGLLLLVCSCLLSSLAQAEVTLDGSVGPAGALTGPNYQVTENLGKRAGSNLFHSFGRFNLNASESATFSGSTGIKNVISRVTGGQASNIDGTLRVSIPNANLYFLNPAGIIFGQNAKLDVPGLFNIGTGDYLKFQDSVRFYSGTATTSPVLTTAAPEDFGFLGGASAGISFLGVSPFQVTSKGSAKKILTIKIPKIFLIAGDFTSKNNLLSKRCTARSGNDLSSFIVKGRGGIPLSPGDLAPSNFMDYSQTEGESSLDKESMDYHLLDIKSGLSYSQIWEKAFNLHPGV